MSRIFESIFRRKIQLSDDLTAADVPGWDSLTHVKILGAIEEAFDIRFNLAEINSLENLGDLVKTIATKLKE